jgi:hypothetical protein
VPISLLSIAYDRTSGFWARRTPIPVSRRGLRTQPGSA